MSCSYYSSRVDTLRDLFGADDVTVTADAVVVDGRTYPVVDDVIITLPFDRLPPAVQARLPETARPAVSGPDSSAFAADVQASFGDEWVRHPALLEEHRGEFAAYFDLVDLSQLATSRAADLGCGNGRWSHFLASHCREIVLVDFSEAIFVARANLRDRPNAIFVMADLLDLPLRDGAIDLGVCLGVLHHLPVDALDATRRLRRVAPRLLVYLYYDLDNRPRYYRTLLHGVTAVRTRLSRVRSSRVRSAIAWIITVTVYVPASLVGGLLRPFGLHRHLPLTETYAGKSPARLHQDAYDRFFTSIEQRVTRAQIEGLRDTFTTVTVSDHAPYWHFRCEVGD